MVGHLVSCTCTIMQHSRVMYWSVTTLKYSFKTTCAKKWKMKRRRMRWETAHVLVLDALDASKPSVHFYDIYLLIFYQLCFDICTSILGCKNVHSCTVNASVSTNFVLLICWLCAVVTGFSGNSIGHICVCAVGLVHVRNKWKCFGSRRTLAT